jgi:hypothetical protein
MVSLLVLAHERGCETDLARPRLTLQLNDLRLPAIKQGWAVFAERADKDGWPAARFLAALAEHELPGATAAASSSKRCRWSPRCM